MKIYKFLFLTIFIIVNPWKGIAQEYPPNSPNWILDPYRSDEFSNGFNTEKWFNGTGWYDCQEDARFLPENIRVQEGELKIDIKWHGGLPSCENISTRFSTGAVKSNFTIGDETYVEVRAKTPHHQLNMNPAIWLSDGPVVEKNPNVEIDILETFEPRRKPKRVSQTIHMWPQNPDYHYRTDANHYTFDWYINETFLNYGLIRDDGWLHFYLHDRFFTHYDVFNGSSFPIDYRQEITKQQRPLVLSVGGNNDISQGPNDSFDIDYVRVYIKKSNCDIAYKTISNPINNSAYIQASGDIKAYSTVDSDFFVTFKAPSVVLKPGFHAAGSSIGGFSVKPGTCYYAPNNFESKNEDFILSEQLTDSNLPIPIISPNPFSNNLIVEKIDNIYSWSIRDNNGKEVSSGNVNNSVQTKITINTSRLISGIYYFNAVMKNGELFQKTVFKK